MLIRRTLLVVIAFIFGFAATHLALWLMNTTPQEFGLWFGTEGDGIAYYPLTIIFFALGIAIWLDKWLDTQILPK